MILFLTPTFDCCQPFDSNQFDSQNAKEVGYGTEWCIV
jgi:hypothetical protein